MAEPLDEQVVELRFDNQNFETNVNQSINTINRLKQSLDFEDAGSSFDSISEAAANCDVEPLGNSLDQITSKFSILENAASVALGNIMTQAINAGASLVKSLTVDQVAAGWSKYESKTQSVQTIMAATGKSIDYVNSRLEKLMWFSDETSYDFADMVNNIGKFTSAGVDLDVAVNSMMGISNWAAISGAGIQQASRAMYNLSQSIGMGYVGVTDWRSIELANMATLEFKNVAIEAGLAMGQLQQDASGAVRTLGGMEVTAENMRNTLSEKWFTSDVLNYALNEYSSFANEVKAFQEAYNIGSATEAIDAMVDAGLVDTESLAYRAFKRAQEAITFTQSIAATTDAVSSSWMRTFELIFGNYEKATELWSGLTEAMYEIFAEPGAKRNETLANILNSDLEKFLDLFDNTDEVSTKLYNEILEITEENLGADYANALAAEYGSLEKLLQKTNIYDSTIQTSVNRLADDYKSDALRYEGLIESLNSGSLTLKNAAIYLASGYYGKEEEEARKKVEALGFEYETLLEYANAWKQGYEIDWDTEQKNYVESLQATVAEYIKAAETLENNTKGEGFFTSLKEISGRDKLIGAFGNILGTIKDIYLYLTTMFESLSGGVSIWQKLIDIFYDFSKIVKLLVVPFEKLHQFLNGYDDAFGNHYAGIFEIIGAAFHTYIEALPEKTQQVFSGIRSKFEGVRSFFTNFIDGIFGKEQAQIHVDDEGQATKVITRVGGLLNDIKDKLLAVGKIVFALTGPVGIAVVSIFNAIANFLSKAKEDGTGVFSIFGFIYDKLSAFWKMLKDIGKTVSKYIMGILPKGVTNAIISFQNKLEPLWAWISKKARGFNVIFENLFSGDEANRQWALDKIKEKLVGTFTVVSEYIQKKIRGAKAILSSLFSDNKEDRDWATRKITDILGITNALEYVQKKFRGAKAILSGLFSDNKEDKDWAVGKVQEILRNIIANIFVSVGKVGKLVLGVFQSLGKKIGSIFEFNWLPEDAKNKVLSVFKTIGNAVSSVSKKFEDIRTKIVTKLSPIFKTIEEKVRKFFEFNWLPESARNKVLSIFQSISKAIDPVIKKLESFLAWIQKKFRGIKAVIGALFSGNSEDVDWALDKIKEKIVGTFTVVSEYIQKKIRGAKAILSSLFSDNKEDRDWATRKITDILGITNALEYVQKKFRGAKAILSGLFSGDSEQIDWALTRITEKVHSIFNGLKDNFKGSPIETFLTGIETALTKLWNSVPMQGLRKILFGDGNNSGGTSQKKILSSLAPGNSADSFSENKSLLDQESEAIDTIDAKGSALDGQATDIAKKVLTISGVLTVVLSIANVVAAVLWKPWRIVLAICAGLKLIATIVSLILAKILRTGFSSVNGEVNEGVDTIKNGVKAVEKTVSPLDKLGEWLNAVKERISNVVDAIKDIVGDIDIVAIAKRIAIVVGVIYLLSKIPKSIDLGKFGKLGITTALDDLADDMKNIAISIAACAVSLIALIAVMKWLKVDTTIFSVGPVAAGILAFLSILYGFSKLIKVFNKIEIPASINFTLPIITGTIVGLIFVASLLMLFIKYANIPFGAILGAIWLVVSVVLSIALAGRIMTQVVSKDQKVVSSAGSFIGIGTMLFGFANLISTILKTVATIKKYIETLKTAKDWGTTAIAVAATIVTILIALGTIWVAAQSVKSLKDGGNGGAMAAFALILLVLPIYLNSMIRIFSAFKNFISALKIDENNIKREAGECAAALLIILAFIGMLIVATFAMKQLTNDVNWKGIGAFALVLIALPKYFNAVVELMTKVKDIASEIGGSEVSDARKFVESVVTVLLILGVLFSVLAATCSMKFMSGVGAASIIAYGVALVGLTGFLWSVILMLKIMKNMGSVDDVAKNFGSLAVIIFVLALFLKTFSEINVRGVKEIGKSLFGLVGVLAALTFFAGLVVTFVYLLNFKDLNMAAVTQFVAAMALCAIVLLEVGVFLAIAQKVMSKMKIRSVKSASKVFGQALKYIAALIVFVSAIQLVVNYLGFDIGGVQKFLLMLFELSAFLTIFALVIAAIALLDIPDLKKVTKLLNTTLGLLYALGAFVAGIKIVIALCGSDMSGVDAFLIRIAEVALGFIILSGLMALLTAKCKSLTPAQLSKAQSIVKTALGAIYAIGIFIAAIKVVTKRYGDDMSGVDSFLYRVGAVAAFVGLVSLVIYELAKHGKGLSKGNLAKVEIIFATSLVILGVIGAFIAGIKLVNALFGADMTGVDAFLTRVAIVGGIVGAIAAVIIAITYFGDSLDFGNLGKAVLILIAASAILAMLGAFIVGIQMALREFGTDLSGVDAFLDAVIKVGLIFAVITVFIGILLAVSPALAGANIFAATGTLILATAVLAALAAFVLAVSYYLPKVNFDPAAFSNFMDSVKQVGKLLLIITGVLAVLGLFGPGLMGTILVGAGAISVAILAITGIVILIVAAMIGLSKLADKVDSALGEDGDSIVGCIDNVTNIISALAAGLGKIIGSFTGALVDSFMNENGGIVTVLANLKSMVVDSLSPFLEEIAKFDKDTFTNVANFDAVMLAITGLNFLNSINNIISEFGGTDNAFDTAMANLNAMISEGGSLKEFLDNVISYGSDEQLTAVKNFNTVMKELLSITWYEKVNSFVSAFGRDTDFTNFSESLKSLGGGLAGFYKEVENTNMQQVITALSAVSRISTLLDSNVFRSGNFITGAVSPASVKTAFTTLLGDGGGNVGIVGYLNKFVEATNGKDYTNATVAARLISTLLTTLSTKWDNLDQFVSWDNQTADAVTKTINWIIETLLPLLSTIQDDSTELDPQRITDIFTAISTALNTISFGSKDGKYSLMDSGDQEKLTAALKYFSTTLIPELVQLNDSLAGEDFSAARMFGDTLSAILAPMSFDENMSPEKIKEKLSAIRETVVTEFELLNEALAESAASEEGNALTTALASIESLSVDLESFKQIGDYVIDGLLLAFYNGDNTNTVYQAAYSLGLQIKNGLSDSLEVNSPSKAAEELGNSVAEGIAEPLEVNSPSKVAEQIGFFVTQGLVIGLKNGSWEVQKAAEMLGLDLNRSLDKYVTQHELNMAQYNLEDENHFNMPDFSYTNRFGEEATDYVKMLEWMHEKFDESLGADSINAFVGSLQAADAEIKHTIEDADYASLMGGIARGDYGLSQDDIINNLALQYYSDEADAVGMATQAFEDYIDVREGVLGINKDILREQKENPPMTYEQYMEMLQKDQEAWDALNSGELQKLATQNGTTWQEEATKRGYSVDNLNKLAIGNYLYARDDYEDILIACRAAEDLNQQTKQMESLDDYKIVSEDSVKNVEDATEAVEELGDTVKGATASKDLDISVNEEVTETHRKRPSASAAERIADRIPKQDDEVIPEGTGAKTETEAIAIKGALNTVSEAVEETNEKISGSYIAVDELNKLSEAAIADGTAAQKALEIGSTRSNYMAREIQEIYAALMNGENLVAYQVDLLNDELYKTLKDNGNKFGVGDSAKQAEELQKIYTGLGSRAAEFFVKAYTSNSDDPNVFATYPSLYAAYLDNQTKQAEEQIVQSSEEFQTTGGNAIENAINGILSLIKDQSVEGLLTKSLTFNVDDVVKKTGIGEEYVRGIADAIGAEINDSGDFTVDLSNVITTGTNMVELSKKIFDPKTLISAIMMYAGDATGSFDLSTLTADSAGEILLSYVTDLYSDIKDGNEEAGSLLDTLLSIFNTSKDIDSDEVNIAVDSSQVADADAYMAALRKQYELTKDSTGKPLLAIQAYNKLRSGETLTKAEADEFKKLRNGIPYEMYTQDQYKAYGIDTGWVMAYDYNYIDEMTDDTQKYVDEVKARMDAGDYNIKNLMEDSNAGLFGETSVDRKKWYAALGLDADKVEKKFQEYLINSEDALYNVADDYGQLTDAQQEANEKAEQYNDILNTTPEGAFRAISDFLSGVNQVIEDPETLTQFNAFMNDAANNLAAIQIPNASEFEKIGNFLSIISTVTTGSSGISADFAVFIKDIVNELNGIEINEEAVNPIIDFFTELSNAIGSLDGSGLSDFLNAFYTGITGSTSQASTAANTIANAILAQFYNRKASFVLVGGYIVKWVADGITANTAQAIDAANTLITNVLATFSTSLSSPDAINKVSTAINDLFTNLMGDGEESAQEGAKQGGVNLSDTMKQFGTSVVNSMVQSFTDPQNAELIQNGLSSLFGLTENEDGSKGALATITDSFSTLTDGITQITSALDTSGAYSSGAAMATGIAQGVNDNLGICQAAGGALRSAFALPGYSDGFYLGMMYALGYAEGVASGGAGAYGAGFGLGKGAAEGTQTAQNSGSPSKVARKLGTYFGQGYTLGIQSENGSAYDAGVGVAEASLSGVADTAGIHSPAKETQKYGRFFDLGMAKGIYEAMNKVVAAGEVLTTETLNSFDGLMDMDNPFVEVFGEDGVNTLEELYATNVKAVKGGKTLQETLSSINLDSLHSFEIDHVTTALDKLRRGVALTAEETQNLNAALYDVKLGMFGVGKERQNWYKTFGLNESDMKYLLNNGIDEYVENFGKGMRATVQELAEAAGVEPSLKEATSRRLDEIANAGQVYDDPAWQKAYETSLMHAESDYSRSVSALKLDLNNVSQSAYDIAMGILNGVYGVGQDRKDYFGEYYDYYQGLAEAINRGDTINVEGMSDALEEAETAIDNIGDSQEQVTAVVNLDTSTAEAKMDQFTTDANKSLEETAKTASDTADYVNATIATGNASKNVTPTVINNYDNKYTQNISSPKPASNITVYRGTKTLLAKAQGGGGRMVIE
jgi:tape measure domain-containing protein